MIKLNDIKLPEQPQTLNEEPKVLADTQQAINGNKQSILSGEVKQVSMSWSYIKPDTAKMLLSLQAKAEAVKYTNDSSSLYGKLEFTGIITVKLGNYVRGGSGLVPCTVKIEEGEVY